MIVSDADDCSVSTAGLEMFDPAGERVFWSDPLADAPTPAVCWNASTECETVDGVLSCGLRRYGPTGATNELPKVMRILSEIIWMISAYSVEWLVIGGIPIAGVDALTFTDQPPEYVLEHGIGPSCDDQQGTAAIPPLRTIDAIYDEPILGSICSPDYLAEFDELGQRLVETLGQPDCSNEVPVCDLDPATPMLDTDCWLVGRRPGEDRLVPECARASEGEYLVDPLTGRPAMPGPGVELCYVRKTDDQAYTSDPLDDVDAACGEFVSASLSFDVVVLDGRSTDYRFYVECGEG